MFHCSTKLLGISILFLSSVLLSACKPKYVPPTETPNVTAAAADKEIALDFTQIHNDVLEALDGDGAASLQFPYVTALNVDGDNTKKGFTVKAELASGQKLPELLEDYLLYRIFAEIGNAAATQDFRYQGQSEDSLGSVFQSYAVDYELDQDGAAVYRGSFPAGEEIRFPELKLSDLRKEETLQRIQSETENWRQNFVSGQQQSPAAEAVAPAQESAGK